jgi:hypothetical protein
MSRHEMRYFLSTAGLRDDVGLTRHSNSQPALKDERSGQHMSMQVKCERSARSVFDLLVNVSAVGC